MSDHLSRAHQLLASGQLDEARIYLEELLRQDAENPDLLYNLGLCYVDLGQLDKGRELLHRCLQLAPEHLHACVALAHGYQRACYLPRAKEYTMRALAADPRNPVALKNRVAINGQKDDSLRALYYLRRSYEIEPQDPQDRARPRLRPLTGDIEPWPRSIPRRCWRCRHPRTCAVWPGTGCERLPSGGSRLGERGWTRSSIRQGHAALPREVAGGGSGDHLRDR
ncbi:MAG TPA: tetratricopeptide repeat protein [Methanothrix sp.]|nr:tetratricopeptide repeat protein [Methanothrix sp.]